MPLSKPNNRKLTHTRIVTCKGYEHEKNKLWDIEGHIVDTKPYSFPNRDRGGEIKKGEALHEMWIRLTIDIDMNIVDAEGCIDASPFNHCHTISSIIQSLAGLQITPGWTRKTRQIMGGKKGCTHLTELLGPMATVAYQTIFSAKGQYAKTTDSNIKEQGKPPFIDQCFSLSADSPVVLEYWPDFAIKSAEDK